MHRLGWRVNGLVAPDWLLSPEARAALEPPPLRYASTLNALYRLSDWQTTGARRLMYSARSGRRRVVSRWWNEGWLARQDGRSSSRIALHPGDADHSGVMDHWRSLLRRGLQRRIAVTKSRWVDRMP